MCFDPSKRREAGSGGQTAEAFRSASTFNDLRMPSMPRCKTLRLYPLSTLGIKPRNDSAECARVPPSLDSKWNT